MSLERPCSTYLKDSVLLGDMRYATKCIGSYVSLSVSYEVPPMDPKMCPCLAHLRDKVYFQMIHSSKEHHSLLILSFHGEQRGLESLISSQPIPISFSDASENNH